MGSPSLGGRPWRFNIYLMPQAPCVTLFYVISQHERTRSASISMFLVWLMFTPKHSLLKFRVWEAPVGASRHCHTLSALPKIQSTLI